MGVVDADAGRAGSNVAIASSNSRSCSHWIGCGGGGSSDGGGCRYHLYFKIIQFRPSISSEKKRKLTSTRLMILNQNPRTHSPRCSISKNPIKRMPVHTTRTRLWLMTQTRFPPTAHAWRIELTVHPLVAGMRSRLLVGSEASSWPNSWPSLRRSNRLAEIGRAHV